MNMTSKGCLINCHAREAVLSETHCCRKFDDADHQSHRQLCERCTRVVEHNFSFDTECNLIRKANVHLSLELVWISFCRIDFAIAKDWEFFSKVDLGDPDFAKKGGFEGSIETSV